MLVGVRLIALLLAVMMMTGTAAEVCAASDIIVAIDDAPDLDMPNLLEPSELARPDHRSPIQSSSAPGASALGRMHAVMIFRPPR
jgi:hypothetical protein